MRRDNIENKFLEQSKYFKEFAKEFKEYNKSKIDLTSAIESIGDSIHKSMKEAFDNLRGNKNIDDFSKFLKDYNIKSEDEVSSLISSLNKGTGKGVKRIHKNFEAALQDLNELQEFTDTYVENGKMNLDKFLNDLSKVYDNEEETKKMVKNFDRAMDEIEGRSKEASESVGNVFNGLSNWVQILQLNSILGNLDNRSNSLIESTRRLQIAAGESYDNIHNYRDFAETVTEDLNKTTGSSYNLKDLYSDMVTLAENSDIARLDTLKEITRPAMLAYRSMNVSLDSISQYTGKLYEFAGIDSLKMEGMLNYVKGISSGMNVNEQTIIDNTNALRNYTLAYANTKDLTTDQIQEIEKAIANVTVLAESSGIDSAEFISTMKEFMANPYTSNLTKRLGVMGINTSTEDLLNSILNGGMDDFFLQYAEAMANMTEETLTKGLGEEYFSTATLSNLETGTTYLNAVKDGVLDKALNDLNKNINEINSGEMDTMEESIADHHLSLLDKVNNNLSTSLTVLTDIKETIGIGFSDVLTAIGIITSLKGLFKASLGSGTGSIIGKLGSTLGATGPIGLAVGAGVVGVAAVASSIYDTVKEINDRKDSEYKDFSDSISDLTEGTKIMYESYAEKDENGKIQTGLRTKVVSEDEYDQEASIKAIEDYYAKEQKINIDKRSKFDWKDIFLMGDGDNWYDYIPMLGGAIQGVQNIASIISLNDSKNEALTRLDFMNSLSGTDLEVFQAYSDTLKDRKSFDYFVKHFDEFANIYKEGYVTEVSEDGLKDDRKRIPAYAEGTNYVPYTQLALIHEGEAIIPKENNPAANTVELETLRNQYALNNYRSNETDDRVVESLKSLQTKVEEIIDTFNSYREDTTKRYEDDKLESRINSNKISLRSNSSKFLPTFI